MIRIETDLKLKYTDQITDQILEELCLLQATKEVISTYQTEINKRSNELFKMVRC